MYVHERLRSRHREAGARTGAGCREPPPGEPELTALAAHGLERALFLDLETCGLSSSPVFLAGTMHWNGEDFVLRQYFARHYGEEAALLAAVHEQARGFESLVTFNGKSYDAPFLAARALTHGVTLALPRHHLDLLHLARRRWKRDLRDCRLQTLECHVCRRRRTGDVPGDEVPGLYHDYVRNGDPYAAGAGVPPQPARRDHDGGDPARAVQAPRAGADPGSAHGRVVLPHAGAGSGPVASGAGSVRPEFARPERSASAFGR